MKKKELMGLRSLTATPAMLQVAAKDTPRKMTTTNYWGSKYTHTERKYDTYVRCEVEDGILKAAFFFPDHLRSGGKLPAYELFVDKAVGHFITYDRLKEKWREAKLDHLDWPDHSYNYYGGPQLKVWAGKEDAKVVQKYLQSKNEPYDAILYYQRQLRAEALERKDKKTLDTWDGLLAPIQNVPKDWVRWVDKVAIEENYIFYEYKKGGVKEGYCTYCERPVPLQVKPRHLMEGACPRCHRKIVYRSTGRSGRLFTEERAAYLIQKYPGGLVVREFWVYRAYQHGGHLRPIINIFERARDIYSNGEYYPFYWGLFKFRTTRWVEGAPCRSCFGYGNAYYRTSFSLIDIIVQVCRPVKAL